MRRASGVLETAEYVVKCTPPRAVCPPSRLWYSLIRGYRRKKETTALYCSAAALRLYAAALFLSPLYTHAQRVALERYCVEQCAAVVVNCGSVFVLRPSPRKEKDHRMRRAVELLEEMARVHDAGEKRDAGTENGCCIYSHAVRRKTRRTHRGCRRRRRRRAEESLVGCRVGRKIVRKVRTGVGI